MFYLYRQFGRDNAVCDCVFVQFLHSKANVLFTILASCMHQAFVYKHWLINSFACRSRRIGCRWSRGVTWGAGALCIGRNYRWSRGEPERAVLVAALVGHVVKWQVEWHVVITSSTCIRPAGITSYLLTSPQWVIFAPLKNTVHGVVAVADACVAACFTVAIYPWFYGRLKQTNKRICIIILLISSHALPWFITPWKAQMTSDEVLVSQSERFNSVERTTTSFLVGLEVGFEGRVGW